MKTICITGLDGCGKSTQAKILSKVLPGSRIVSVWDIIKRPEFQEWSIYKMPPPVEQYVVNLSPLSRTLFIFHAFNEAYQKALKSEAQWLIFDGYWYKYWAIEQSMGAPKALASFFAEQYMEPDFSFYLNLPVEDIIKRKKHLSVYETANHKDDWKKFESIQTKAQQILENLLPSSTVFMDAKQSPEEISRFILSTIKD